MTVYLRTYTRESGAAVNAAEVFKFPGGEVHLRNIDPEIDERTLYIADVRGADAHDLVAASLWADVARDREQWFGLLLPYLPAARSDRGEPTGAWVYAKIVNAMLPDWVIGIDPHSAYIADRVDNLRVLDPVPLLTRALRDAGHLLRYDGVIAPDAGATDRAAAAAAALDADLYQAEKRRDFDTGKILSYKMTEKLPLTGRYLVVDDICDGGGTFRFLADATGLPSSRLGLWVTHGIFSGEATKLRHYYDNIYTTDSHPGHSRPYCATVVVPTLTYMHKAIERLFR